MLLARAPSPTPITLLNILLDCEDLRSARKHDLSLWADFLREKPFLFRAIKRYTNGKDFDKFIQFLSDCTVLPDLISLRQLHGDCLHYSLLYLTRKHYIFKTSRKVEKGKSSGQNEMSENEKVLKICFYHS